jgi:2-aminoadipate transaminase
VGYINQKNKFFAGIGDKGLFTAYNYTDTMGPKGPRDAFAEVYGRDFNCKLNSAYCIPSVGATGGIAMLCSLFERPGKPISYITDAPTYPGFLARACLHQSVSVYSAEMDQDGPIIDRLRDRIRQSRDAGLDPAFYYTIPDGHNPAGISFSAKRREQIMQVMQDENLLVVEDAPYSYISFQNQDKRPPLLVALDASRCAHLFTASKIGLPGPRVGFIYSEARMQIKHDQQVSLTDLLLTESAANLLLQNPEALLGFEAYLRNPDLSLRQSMWPVAAQKSKVYGENRQILLSVLDKRLGMHPELFHWTRPDAGFFSVFTFKSGRITTDAQFVQSLVANYGVVTIPMSGFYPADARARNPRAGLDQLRLSFSFNEAHGQGRRDAVSEAANAFCDAVIAAEGI